MPMKGIDNQRHIAALLDRFLQGTTTVEEEKAKGEKYREMLAKVAARLDSLK